MYSDDTIRDIDRPTISPCSIPYRRSLLEARRQRNRESASRSRDRTKSTVAAVHQELLDVRNELAHLRHQYEQLSREFEALKRGGTAGDAQARNVDTNGHHDNDAEAASSEGRTQSPAGNDGNDDDDDVEFENDEDI